MKILWPACKHSSPHRRRTEGTLQQHQPNSAFFFDAFVPQLGLPQWQTPKNKHRLLAPMSHTSIPKIDLCLLPLMWFCYGTQQADKTSLSVQAVFGIREDNGLVGNQFNWLSTVFYLSYMVCEFPANWLMQKCHTGKFLSIVMVGWGVVVLCIAFSQNFTHLMVLRTLQGALECTISPTFILITGAWYTSREHTLRSLIWGTSNAGMNIITGLCMYAIGQHAERHPGGLAPVSFKAQQEDSPQADLCVL
jgi:sugar phosphate permease